MVSKPDILSALQFSLLNSSDPLNLTSDPRRTITYQYAGTSEPEDLPTSSTYTEWTAFSAGEKTAFEAALAHIESFLNVEFVEVTGSDDPDLNVGKVYLPGTTAGYGGYSASYSGSTITRYDGYVVYDNTIDLTGSPDLILHELGHSLGLKHPFSAPTLPAAFENNKYSIMSYSENPDNGLDADAMMLFDVFALQDIWGEVGYNAGNTTYSAPRTDTVDPIWDTGGRDTLNASSRSSDVTLNLKAGKFSSFDATDDVVITYGTVIENATGGSGNDRLIGNGARNTLKGGGGNDTIKAGGGNDKLKGQAGDDTLKGDKGNDKLLGGSGDDTLKGGGQNDTLKGQGGDDTLFGQNGADKFVFAKGDGNDTIADFQNNKDSIQFNKLGDVDAVLTAATQVGDDVLFDFGGSGTLTVLGTTIGALSDDIIA
ncbi:MAG: M10 family metallopeptidase [Antarcticimicrobium sp.]|uniref:M10 family metallopeptidase n=1 Tax=Antarcticimicrobium sp. TaxID=2824147 RepID=UPI002615CE6D|nr:M10 family metallopeptidase [Antarcticimicrobium sp.]MDF1718240.1 M10 family metallopeptidase [Antarcticimicrobium sp.]